MCCLFYLLVFILSSLKKLQAVLDPLVAERAVRTLRKIQAESVLVQPLAHLVCWPFGERQRVQNKRRYRVGHGRVARGVAIVTMVIAHRLGLVTKIGVVLTLEASVRCRSEPAAFKRTLILSRHRWRKVKSSCSGCWQMTGHIETRLHQVSAVVFAVVLGRRVATRGSVVYIHQTRAHKLAKEVSQTLVHARVVVSVGAGRRRALAKMISGRVVRWAFLSCRDNSVQFFAVRRRAVVGLARAQSSRRKVLAIARVGHFLRLAVLYQIRIGVFVINQIAHVQVHVVDFVVVARRAIALVAIILCWLRGGQRVAHIFRRVRRVVGQLGDGR